MIIMVARSLTGFAVLVGADVVSDFARLQDAQLHAESLCAQAKARGQDAEWVDLSESDAPPVLRKPR